MTFVMLCHLSENKFRKNLDKGKSMGYCKDMRLRNQNKESEMSDRIKIRAGKVNVGDEFRGRVVTGLGKTWTVHISDDDACCYGLEPGQDCWLDFQYAYFD